MIDGLSGPFGNASAADWRNLLWAVERVSTRGAVRLPGAPRRLELQRFDSKGRADWALSVLRSALDQQFGFVLRGNSWATVNVLIDALNKHNERSPATRALFLSCAAVDPALTRQLCSFCHFRFGSDADADMRLVALMDGLQDDRSLSNVYLIGRATALANRSAARPGP